MAILLAGAVVVLLVVAIVRWWRQMPGQDGEWTVVEESSGAQLQAGTGPEPDMDAAAEPVRLQTPEQVREAALKELCDYLMRSPSPVELRNRSGLRFSVRRTGGMCVVVRYHKDKPWRKRRYVYNLTTLQVFGREESGSHYCTVENISTKEMPELGTAEVKALVNELGESYRTTQ